MTRANGDRHFGHLTGWGDGFAVVGGTRIDGVVFIDAAPIESGGLAPDEAPGPASGDDDATRCVVVPAALATRMTNADCSSQQSAS